jgi:hypothetical protein
MLFTGIAQVFLEVPLVPTLVLVSVHWRVQLPVLSTLPSEVTLGQASRQVTATLPLDAVFKLL